jgi:hypothetical protein
VIDLPYYSPAIFVFSNLEIQVAFICALMPIFWPLLESIHLNKISVTQEVQVVTESREPDSSCEEHVLVFSQLQTDSEPLRSNESNERKDY